MNFWRKPALFSPRAVGGLQERKNEIHCLENQRWPEHGENRILRRKPNGITRADKETRKSDDLLRRNFDADKPLTKCVTDITEVKGKDGKLHVSAVFDCCDSCVLGLAMDTNMRASLCVQTLQNAHDACHGLRGVIIHSDRGAQYTSQEYRAAVSRYGILQSMNSAGGRCHDNARCESMWARMKDELLYGRWTLQYRKDDH